MKCLALFTLFLVGCTALLPFSPGSSHDRNALQTVDARPETAVSPGDGEESVDASPRYIPVYPLPPCCPSTRFWYPIRCRDCAHTSTALPTPVHGSTLPWFDNFTMPVPTGHHTRATHTTQTLNATTSTVSTTFVSTVTNRFSPHNEYENTHPTPTTLANVPTVPNPSGAPPFLPHWPPHQAPCTTTLTTTSALNLAPKTAAGTTVTETKSVDCHGCKLEIKTEDRFGHGPMVSSAFVTVPRCAASATATETVRRCFSVAVVV